MVVLRTTTPSVASPKGGHTASAEKPLNLWRRSQRARTIAAERARQGKHGRAAPVPWRSIATRHGITARQAERIYAEFCSWEQSQRDPLRTVDESILLRQALLDQLGQLAEEGDNTSAKVGACRAMLDVDRERLELMKDAGRLPRNLTRHRADTEFIVIVRELMDALERRGVGREATEEVMEIVGGHIDPLALRAT